MHLSLDEFTALLKAGETIGSLKVRLGSLPSAEETQPAEPEKEEPVKEGKESEKESDADETPPAEEEESTSASLKGIPAPWLGKATYFIKEQMEFTLKSVGAGNGTQPQKQAFISWCRRNKKIARIAKNKNNAFVFYPVMGVAAKRKEKVSI